MQVFLFFICLLVFTLRGSNPQPILSMTSLPLIFMVLISMGILNSLPLLASNIPSCFSPVTTCHVSHPFLSLQTSLLYFHTNSLPLYIYLSSLSYYCMSPSSMYLLFLTYLYTLPYFSFLLFPLILLSFHISFFFFSFILNSQFTFHNNLSFHCYVCIISPPDLLYFQFLFISFRLLSSLFFLHRFRILQSISS